MVKSKKKSSSDHSRGPGYRVFMSNFATYAKENDIHIRGGRGSFAKKAGEVWHDLKAKPKWKDNLDVILPQYLEDVEGYAEIPKLSEKDRRRKIVEELGPNQFEWWNIKSLYGLWIENPNVYFEKDRLFVLDSEGLPFEISNEEDSFALYRMIKEEVDSKLIEEYSSVSFEGTDLNDNEGIDIVFSISESSEYRRKLHETTSFEWDKKVKDKFAIQKEAVGEKGVAKLARTKFKTAKAAKRDVEGITTPEEAERVKSSGKRLTQLNEAISRLESQLDRGLITKTEYKKVLKNLYKL